MNKLMKVERQVCNLSSQTNEEVAFQANSYICLLKVGV